MPSLPDIYEIFPSALTALFFLTPVVSLIMLRTLPQTLSDHKQPLTERSDDRRPGAYCRVYIEMVR